MLACIVRGSPEAALASSPHRLHGTVVIGGQDHFYLEGQIAVALPQEDGCMLIHSSTQHPTEVQHIVAHALARQANNVTVQCRRMGGGFGGGVGGGLGGFGGGGGGGFGGFGGGGGVSGGGAGGRF